MLMTEKQTLDMITKYVKENIFESHIYNSIKKHSKLKSYNINPIVVKYLSKVLEDDFTPIGIAKALYLPRVLGTSINTTFGTIIQKMFIELDLANPSIVQGMDIEFIDKIDGRQKWCQLKSGPNTINSGDVNPLINKFNTVANLARTNTMTMNNTDLVLGVLYGEAEQLSQHYKKIDEVFTVYIGKEFWHRLTGFPDFYSKLVKSLDTMILTLDTKDFYEKGYTALAEEIKSSDLFDFA